MDEPTRVVGPYQSPDNSKKLLKNKDFGQQLIRKSESTIDTSKRIKSTKHLKSQSIDL